MVRWYVNRFWLATIFNGAKPEQFLKGLWAVSLRSLPLSTFILDRRWKLMVPLKNEKQVVWAYMHLALSQVFYVLPGCAPPQYQASILGKIPNLISLSLRKLKHKWPLAGFGNLVAFRVPCSSAFSLCCCLVFQPQGFLEWLISNFWCSMLQKSDGKLLQICIVSVWDYFDGEVN